MPYNRQIPDAPIALSMLPRITEPQDTDLIYLVRPTNPIGQRSGAMALGELADFTKGSTGWISLETTALVGNKVLANLEVPKGYGGRFFFKFDMQYSDTGSISPGYVQDLQVHAYDIDRGADFLINHLQRIFHDASGNITGSGAVVATHWYGSVETPDSTWTTEPDSRDIHLSIVLPYADTIQWALTNIKIKAELWKEHSVNNLSPI